IHSNGIYLLKNASTDEKLKAPLASLKAQNVGFEVCANTLKGKKIAQSDLYEVFDEDIVPSGVAELSHLQQQGYTYIKP
ncbi:MAG: DsrE family protein, partial [Rhodospirillales bacterium]|nr:DsrE family protein [Rhodospirillales bacterium]MCW9003569.1 DsrE family protein [Rhodospirillales bacterium]